MFLKLVRLGSLGARTPSRALLNYALSTSIVLFFVYTILSLGQISKSFSTTSSSSYDISVSFSSKPRQQHDDVAAFIFKTRSCPAPSPITKRLLDALEPSSSSSSNTTWPEWLQQTCPEVVDHFTRFPYFAEFNDLPVMTTLFAAHSVCTVKLAQRIAASVNAKLYLHAGSHLGAVLHAGPIPFDDDVDMFLEFNKKDEFLSECNKLYQFFPGAKLECRLAFNAIKISVIAEGSRKTKFEWSSPFADIFFFKVQNETLFEIWPNGQLREQAFRIDEFFPTRPFYFGGLYVMGPRESIAAKRYKLDICKLSSYSHRLEDSVHIEDSLFVDCCELSKHLPFVYDHSYLFNGENLQRIVDPRALDSSFAYKTWYTPRSSRKTWATLDASQGPKLSHSLPNINTVEIDNSLSKCRGKTNLTVVEFNLERGTHWLFALDILKSLHADIIILNEMDIGMARSNQQHTTRLLAYAMNMNYAWGLEFMELTTGTKEEQEWNEGMYNFLGLHGNAILSKCELFDPVVYRNEVGKYFDHEPNSVNARGYEKRLGGRMGLFAKARIAEDREIVIGSIHKLDGYKDEIKAYINGSKAVIAGDQDWNFCENVGLPHVDNQSHHTWKASCTSLGGHRGDIICSNMGIARDEETMFPCSVQYGNSILLSDHAVTHVVLEV